MTETIPSICPRLGLAGDRTVTQTAPNVGHRCYAQTPPGRPDEAYQAAHCLSTAHAVCPFFTPAQAAPHDEPAAGGREGSANWRVIVPVALLLVLVLAMAGLYGRAILTPGSSRLATATVNSFVAKPSVTPEPSAAQEGQAAAVPVSEKGSVATQIRPVNSRFATPTPEPGGLTVVISPTLRDAGWWGSGNVKSGHLGAQLLAGYFDGQVYASAVRFDLQDLPPGAPVREVTLRLTGQQNDRLNTFAGGSWLVQFLDPNAIGDLARLDYEGLFNAPSVLTLEPKLNSARLQPRVTNSWTLDDNARKWLEGQIRDEVPYVTMRILGPVGGAPTLFGWDSGFSSGSGNSDPPQLVVSLGPPPAVAPVLAARRVIVPTETPANVMTAAAYVGTATAIYSKIGTYTPTPVNAVSATPLPPLLRTAVARGYTGRLAPVVTATPTPANAETAQAYAEFATAVARTTGTFTPMPANVVTPFLVTPTPRPTNALTAMAQSVGATAQARATGTVTPLPFNAIIATVTPGPYLVTSTPTPANAATAFAHVAYATAVAYTTGTFTPMPPGAMTPTPYPTVTPLPLFVDELTPAPTPTPTLGPGARPPDTLVGKVLFRTDRSYGSVRLYMLDPATGKLTWVTQAWPFEAAQALEGRAPDGHRRVVVHNDIRGYPELYVIDDRQEGEKALTKDAKGRSYDAVWSPTGEQIAYVSDEEGNDEIYVIDADGKNLKRLTTNDWEWDKHPSWSPDGKQIIFWSNRESGRRQLWIMNVDGSNQRKLLDTPFNDWDAIWIK